MVFGDFITDPRLMQEILQTMPVGRRVYQPSTGRHGFIVNQQDHYMAPDFNYSEPWHKCFHQQMNWKVVRFVMFSERPHFPTSFRQVMMIHCIRCSEHSISAVSVACPIIRYTDTVLEQEIHPTHSVMLLSVAYVIGANGNQFDTSS